MLAMKKAGLCKLGSLRLQCNFYEKSEGQNEGKLEESGKKKDHGRIMWCESHCGAAVDFPLNLTAHLLWDLSLLAFPTF